MTDTEPTEEDISKWTEEFKKMADVDGYITRNDLEVQLQRDDKNPTDTDLDYLIGIVQRTDSDGKICLEDYIQIQTNAPKMSFFTSDIQQDLLKALEAFDENGDGTMKKEDLKSILVDYDDATLDDVIAHADINKDGRLSIKVLSAYLTRTAS